MGEEASAVMSMLPVDPHTEYLEAEGLIQLHVQYIWGFSRENLRYLHACKDVLAKIMLHITSKLILVLWIWGPRYFLGNYIGIYMCTLPPLRARFFSVPWLPLLGFPSLSPNFSYFSLL